MITEKFIDKADNVECRFIMNLLVDIADSNDLHGGVC